MRERIERGNTLALIAAVTIVIAIVIIFLLLYVSMLRSNTEHKSAIEAAALAAARDISKIVVETDECGWVSLCSQPPIGNGTVAGDAWNQEVNSINELMATARLNMIVGQELSDPFMKDLALQDLAAVKTAKDSLTAAIRASLTPGGTAKDAAGNNVMPYQSALQAYLKNQAKGSNYVANTLMLSLGGVEGGIQTSTPSPKPLSKGACSTQQADGLYLSEMNVPYLGADFVFGSVGKRVGLCENSKYRDTIPGLPYQMPAVVKVEAQQQFQDQGKTWMVTFVACACAGSLEAPRPKPGALTISFPDGPLPEFDSPGQIYSQAQMQKTGMDVYTSTGGDFIVDQPLAALAPYSVPPQQPIPWGSPPSAAELAKLALYDWIRCGGSNVNIDSVLSMQALNFQPPSTPQVMWTIQNINANPPTLIDLGMINRGVMHIYTFKPDGTVDYKWTDIKPAPYTVVGENQIYAELSDSAKGLKTAAPGWKLMNKSLPDLGSGGAKIVDIKPKDRFDFYVRDLSRQLGGKRGGRHGGERMDGNPLISTVYGRPAGDAISGDPICYGTLDPLNCFDSTFAGVGEGPGTTTTGKAGPGIPPMITRQDDFASSSVPPPKYYTYTKGTGGGSPRPCYNTKNGLAADIRFRRQVDVGDFSYYLGGFKTGYVGEMQ